MSRLVLLDGVSGAGKSTVGCAVERASTIEYVYASTVKLTFLREGETLQRLDQRRSFEVNERFFDTMPATTSDVLVDTHATYPRGDGFVRLTPGGAGARLDGIVHLEAPLETIRARRIARGRTHEPVDAGSIAREAAAEREEVERLRRAHGMPVLTLDTALVPVERAAGAVVRFVAGLSAARGCEAP